MKFDVNTAITVLSNCGCDDEALFLAKKNEFHTVYLRILIEKKSDFEGAVAYIKSARPPDLRHSHLAFPDAETALQLFGRSLLDHVPAQACALITTLCIDYQPLPDDDTPVPPTPATTPVPTTTVTPSDRSAPTTPVLPAPLGSLTPQPPLGALTPQPPLSSLRQHIRYSLRSRRSLKASVSLSAAAPALLATLGESAITPVYGNPSQYIPLFAGHIELLQQFLEQVTQRAQPCDTSTWNTLLELQLREEKAAQGEVKARAHEKVMKTLTQPEAQYDKEEALVLVQSYEHQEGQLFLYKEMGMYSLLLQHYLAMKDFPAIVSLCQEMQSGADNLWIELLMVIARAETVDLPLLQQILNYIERNQVLPILYALQILSQNERVTVSMVQQFITRSLQKERGIIQTVRLGVRREA